MAANAPFRISNDRGIPGGLNLANASHTELSLVCVPHRVLAPAFSLGTCYHDSANNEIPGVTYTFVGGNGTFQGGTGDPAYFDLGLNNLGWWDSDASNPSPHSPAATIAVWSLTTPVPFSGMVPIYLNHECYIPGGSRLESLAVGDVSSLFTGAGTQVVTVNVGENLHGISVWCPGGEDPGLTSGWTITVGLSRARWFGGPRSVLARGRRGMLIQ